MSLKEKLRNFDPFAEKTDKQLTNELLEKVSIKKDLETLEALGKAMLADGRYAKYKETLGRILGDSIKNLLAYKQPDNNIYAVNVRTALQRIKDALTLVDAPVDWLNEVAMRRNAMPKKDTTP